MSYVQLKIAGFLFTQTAIMVSLLKGDFGDGYAQPAAVIGSPEGLRTWAVTIAALPDSDAQVPKIDSLTRSEYLWGFFLARKAAGDNPFWIQDPKDGLFYLASFVDDTLSYDILCGGVYGVGLQLRQRRVTDQTTPVSVLP